MVTVGERKGEIVECKNKSKITKTINAMDLVEELIGVIEAVKSLGEYQKTHKTESHRLLRRLKLLLPLLEEIRDLNSSCPEECTACLLKLKKAFQTAKKLLKISHGGSKIYLVASPFSFLNYYCYILGVVLYCIV